jgi:hypothetical protein
MEPVGVGATTFDGVGLEQPTSIGSRPIISEQLVHIDLQDERIQDVLGRIMRAVKAEHADAEFVSYIGTNPLGIYVEVYTLTQEFQSILRILDDKLGNLHIAAGVNICIVPKRKVKAVAA